MAYDEAASLKGAVEEISNELAALKRSAEIIIVDDGSKDGTGVLAEQLAQENLLVRVIHHPENRGLGGVYRTGFFEAKLDHVTFFPADGQFPASIISKFVEVIDRSDSPAGTDLVLGYLPNRKDPWLNKVLSFGERLFYRLLFGWFPRFQGIMMFRRAMLSKMDLVSTGRGWAVLMEFILRAHHAGHNILSVPTEIRPRRSGQSKVNNLPTILSNVRQIFALRQKLEVSPWPLVLPVLLAAILLLHLFTLNRYPAPFVDEGWFGSRAWAFHGTGRAFGPLDGGVFDRFPGYWTYFPWLPVWLQSLFYSASDSPTLMPIRLLSLFSGIALLGAIFAIGKQISGRSTAWLGTFLLSLSGPFLYSAHLARYDVLVAAFGFSAIALALRTGDSNRLDLLSGLVVAAAFETHPNGALYGPIVLAIYMMHRDKRIWKYIAGVLIGLTLYAGLHVVRYPDTWMAINRIAGGGTHIPPIATPSLLIGSFQKFLSLMWYSTPFVSILLLPSLIWFVLHRTRANRIVLLLSLSSAAVPVLLIQHKLLYYVILFSPAFDLAVAHFFFEIRRNSYFKRPVKIALQTVLVVVLACAAMYNLLPLRWNWNEDFQRVKNELQKSVQPGESIMGNQVWWLALPEHPWKSWEVLYYYRRYRPEATLEEAFTEFSPKLFIVDLHVETFIRKTPGSSYAAQMGIPEDELRAFLVKRGRLRKRFDGGYYGTIYLIELKF